MSDSDTFDPADPQNQKTVGNIRSDNPRMTCRGVDVFYADKQAIFNVSLDIGKNEVSP
jgi:phosphate transport system ATP-binding protein